MAALPLGIYQELLLHQATANTPFLMGLRQVAETTATQARTVGVPAAKEYLLQSIAGLVISHLRDPKTGAVILYPQALEAAGIIAEKIPVLLNLQSYYADGKNKELLAALQVKKPGSNWALLLVPVVVFGVLVWRQNAGTRG